jgi:hypothetical protein
MKKDLKRQNLALIVSLLLLGLVGGGYFFLWRSAQPSLDSNVVLEDKYNVVEIGSVKKQAQELLQTKANLIQMPIKAPTEKVGRDNPFAQTE